MLINVYYPSPLGPWRSSDLRLRTPETETLSDGEKFAVVTCINRELIGKTEGFDPLPRVVLDLDRIEISVYGR